MFPQATPKRDSTLIIGNRNDQPENAYFTGRLGSKTPNEVFKEGQNFEVIQETAKALHNEKSDSIEPENPQDDLLSSSLTTEDTVAVDMLTHQTGISNRNRICVYAGL